MMNKYEQETENDDSLPSEDRFYLMKRRYREAGKEPLSWSQWLEAGMPVPEKPGQ